MTSVRFTHLTSTGLHPILHLLVSGEEEFEQLVHGHYSEDWRETSNY